MTNQNESVRGAAAGGEPDVMLTKRELAGRLRLTVKTVEKWQRQGLLPYLKVSKVVLFHWPDVVGHLKANFRICRPACK